MTEKMTVAEGIQELKRIDKLIDSRFEQIYRYSSKKKGAKDEIENQRQYIKEQTQSARDLIQRYLKIKTAIQAANLTSVIEFNNRRITVAEAIYMKQWGSDKITKLLDSFSPTNAQMQLNGFRTIIAAMTKEAIENNLNAQVALADANLIPELFYDAVAIQKEREEHELFMSKINVLIDKSNHQTIIEI